MMARLKPLSFLPALLICCMIWSFSAREAEDSAQMSGGVGEIIIHACNRMFRLEMEEEEVLVMAEQLQPVVRKGAHLSEYFLLALAATLPIFVYGRTSGKFFLLAGLLCLLFAVSDEFHQSFVPGRSAELRDVLIDSAGICAGLLLAMTIISKSGRIEVIRRRMP